MLSAFLISELFAFLLVFCRLGSALMMMPGFGEAYVSMRIRLMLALAMSLIMTPALIDTLPPLPGNVFALVNLIVAEILIGAFLGTLARLLISAIHMAGMIIAYQSSLASALIPEMGQGGQGSVIGNMLTLAAMVIIFASDTHHIMLRGIADSYSLFFPGIFPIVGDFAAHASKIMSGAFEMSMKLAAPHIIVGLIFYLGNGIIARLMPNMQVFFIMIPPQIFVSFILLMTLIGTLLLWYIDYFRETMGSFLAVG